MTAEWISIGLLALLVLFFVLDIAGNRKRAPRPEKVSQRKPEVAKGPAPVAPEQAPEPEVQPEQAPEVPEAEAMPEAAPAVPAEPAPVEEAAPAVEPAPEPEPEPEPEPQLSVFERIKKGLGKTRASLTGGLADLFTVGKKIDEDLLEEIETTLLMADVKVTATSEIIESLTDKLERNQLKDGEALRKALREELHGLLKDVTRPLEIDTGKQPYVILMVGVNGVGKTTKIGRASCRER